MPIKPTVGPVHPAPVTALVACLLLCGNALADDTLLGAVKSRDTAAVHALLQQGTDPNAIEGDGTSALAWAVHNNHAEVAIALLQAGADATATNRYGVGPMYLAAENGSATILEALLAHGADPNTTLPDGETTLMTAARAGNPAAVQLLLAAGADVNASEDWKGQTALMWAAAANNAEVVTALLNAGADVHAWSTGEEFDALSLAVRAGALDATRALLDGGANVNGETRENTSMLVLAVINAHFELADLLLQYGADPDADRQGWTALHQLAWSRRWNRGFNLPGPVRTGSISGLELARRLVDAGANINARMHDEPVDGRRNVLKRIGATPFLLAARTCDLPLMRTFLDLGADPAIKTEDGASALMVAAGVGNWAPGENPGTPEECLAAVKLAHQVGGGDVNDVDGNNDTAVHGAIYRGGLTPMIEYLAEHGARLDVMNRVGWTPLIAADGVVRNGSGLKHYHEAAALIRQLLRERGIEPDATAADAGH